MSLEIRLEVLRTRSLVVKGYDADLAVTTSRARPLKVACDVGGTSDVSIVAGDAVANLHASIARAAYDDNLIGIGTSRIECLPLAELGLH